MLAQYMLWPSVTSQTSVRMAENVIVQSLGSLVF